MTPSRRPTQVDVASRAGVSRQTVSLVVLGDPRVSDEKREAVRAAMAELGYRPNITARALAAKRSRLVGIVVLDVGNPFHSDLLESLHHELELMGLVPLIAVTGARIEAERRAVERFVQMGVDGLMIVAPMEPLEEIARVGAQVPTVLLTHGVSPEGVDLIRTDDDEGERLVVDHMLEAGYAPIVHLSYDRGIDGDSASARTGAYQRAMESAGLESRTVNVLETPVQAAVEALVDEVGPGLGLVCHNDLIAIEAMGVVLDAGLRVGRDVAVAGFDDTSLAAFPGISLTSVDQAREEMARAAAGALKERLEGRSEAREIVLPTRLVRRRSTAPRR